MDTRKLLKIASVVAALVANVHSAASGDGSNSANACTGACTGVGSAKKCTFTAKLDIFASATGYYTFEECGNQIQPVLEMEQGVEYTFLQSDDSNWLHPLGFAYEPDGAHEGVDELEAGISKSGDGCDTNNTCQAPMYYQGTAFLGANDPDTGIAEPIVYPADGNSGNFGLDVYEPRFQVSRGNWISHTDKFSVKLTITDTSYTKDLFYFCHIHNRMSGRIKIVDASGTQLSSSDDPALYDFVLPTNFDIGCGTFGLGQYSDGKVCAPQDTHKFFCSSENETAQSQSYGECLYAMDCAMHTEMRVDAHPDDPLTTFMHQMIPHHHNAVNMAKATLKKVPLNSVNDPDGELQDLFWSIVNEQNMQITFMEGWLVGENRKTYLQAICSEATTVSAATPTPVTTTDVPSVGASTVSTEKYDDCKDEREGYLVWAAVTTALLIATWLFIVFTHMNKPAKPTEYGSKVSSTNI